MRRVKLFKSIESELWTMEKEINQWVEESGAQIVSVTGNIAPQAGKAMQGFSASDVLVIVTYEPAE
jgi:predicted phosphatase